MKMTQTNEQPFVANFSIDDNSRTVTGIVVPWNKVGHPGNAPVMIAENSITIPHDLKRVKLLRDHSTRENFSPVGYATAAESTPEGLRMSFKIGNTPDGDLALADVREGIRDALSVELMDTDIRGGVLTAGTLMAVALVPLPAFDDARVESLTAAKENNMNTEGTLYAAQDEPEITGEATTDEPQRPTPNREPDAPAPQAPTDQQPEPLPAGNHYGLQASAKPRLMTFDKAVETIAAMRTGVASPDMTAALADITRSANPAISAPAWLGTMWEGAEYTREIIPTMTQKPLVKLRAIGWRFVQKPEIEDYAGDKAPIPTNTVSTEPVEVVAKRMAVGHDIDRAYFDFNETEFLSEFFKARANDYAIKSDAKAAQFLVASAGTGAAIGTEPDILHAAARARLEIRKAVRQEPTAYLVNPDSMFGLFDITQLDNPAYLDLLGVRPEKFVPSDLVPAGQVIAYNKAAVTWFELAGSPLRVDAERLDRGGKDSGIFAYWATLLNNQKGILSVPFGQAPVTAV